MDLDRSPKVLDVITGVRLVFLAFSGFLNKAKNR